MKASKVQKPVSKTPVRRLVKKDLSSPTPGVSEPHTIAQVKDEDQNDAKPSCSAPLVQSTIDRVKQELEQVPAAAEENKQAVDVKPPGPGAPAAGAPNAAGLPAGPVVKQRKPHKPHKPHVWKSREQRLALKALKVRT